MFIIFDLLQTVHQCFFQLSNKIHFWDFNVYVQLINFQANRDE